MINCIIVDDEPLARQLILSYVDQLPEINCLGSYPNAVEAFDALHRYTVDVIFIDIEMPGISGLNFIKSLKTHPKVIFITAYPQYAVDAFEIEAADYLLKPITFERFLKTIQKITSKTNAETDVSKENEATFIFLKVDRRLVKVDLASILYTEALGDYLKVHTHQQVYVVYMTLNKLEVLLPTLKFIRIHRSTIVNTSYIEFIEGNHVRLNGIDLVIGQTYREKLFKQLQQTDT